jgi:hypothetical protein
MPFQKGNKYGNRKGRPLKGDSLAELIRTRWKPVQRQTAVDALAAKANAGDVQAWEALAKRGWPEEARGELSFTVPNDDNMPAKVTIELHRA